MTELKELVRRNIALSEDTRRMVRDMRREIWWGRFFRVLWMIVTVVIVLAVYYYYLRPYVQQIEALYKYIQPQVVQSHNLDTQLSNFMKTHFSQ